MVQEVNFDGLIGPTHNYAGLSIGNIASATNARAVSNPKAAALQGLKKMRAVSTLGLVQGFLPPLARPDLASLRKIGFSGSPQEIVEAAFRESPELLANFYSASSMWTANAGTVAPSVDTPDGKVHFTPANLAHNFHRTIEGDDTGRVLKHIFGNGTHFVHHSLLPGGVHFGDEGAANHGRFAASHGDMGVHLFVFGEDGDRFPARQKRLASEAVARGHGLTNKNAVFIKQSRRALDAGAFHNDVVGVVNGNVLFCHEHSFENRSEAIAAIRKLVPDLELIEARDDAVPLEDVISSYLFNSQLLSLDGGEMALVMPEETKENPKTKAFVDATLAGNNPINRAEYLDVRESMRNGGGPACLRLRVVLSDEELAATNQNFILNQERFSLLEGWVSEHYRDRLAVEDLGDPQFCVEVMAAMDALTQILQMGSFYDFQKN